MGAIVGIYQHNSKTVNLENGIRMMKELEKYPSNAIQSWHSEQVFLGCLSQWITPESVNEVLPYYDPLRKIAITSDAIIDNRTELFDKLQVVKSLRKTITDSELILLSYIKWDEDAPKHLIGDFAFMIWDEAKKKLFGARDFSGSRTLYYYQCPQFFSFCTTIQPLLSLPNVEMNLNEEWLAEFLAIVGMIDTADASQSVYKNIMQVPPSHSITLTDGKLKISQYCTLSRIEMLQLRKNDEYVEAFREIFQDAIESRLRTNREVAAQLSGGLDSGSIVSFAAKQLKSENKILHTFSYYPPSDFDDFTPPYLMADERPFIKQIVNHAGNIKDYYLDFIGRDPYTEIDGFLNTMEMPYKFFENSFWLKGMFEKANEEGAGVLLNGGRGNLTISWGSAIEFYARLLKRLKWIHLFNELSQYSRNLGIRRIKLLSSITKEAFPLLNRQTDTAYHFPSIINTNFAKKTNVFEKLRSHGIGESGWFSTSNIFEQKRKHFEEVSHWNASNTLAAKFSLKYSLWKRDPTNDLRVIRFCLSLPEEQFVQNGIDRALIRRATKNYLPERIRLNQVIRGVQGADWVYRMTPHWKTFLAEVDQMRQDKNFLEFINSKVLSEAINSLANEPRSEYAINPNYKIIMRCLIVRRFLKKII